jgi:beta-glucosidase
LITEADIDIALTNIFKLRFRLGQFDPDELCPFTSISQDRLCCAEHSDTALEAARKSIVLLQNDGILPLDKEKCGKTLVLGDIAEKNLADWYSGHPPEAIAPLDAIRDIIGDNSVHTVSIHDTCAIFNDDENGWLRLDEEGNVTFDGDIHTRAIFEEIDWGFNSVSYRSASSGKYLNLMPDRTLGCISDMVWGWFTHELFLRNESDRKFLPHGHLYGDRYNDEQKAEISIMVSALRSEILSDGLMPVVEAAASADKIIIVLGNHPLINGRECFDRPAITFPKRWTQLLERVAAVNKNIILTLIAGYPYAFPEESKLARAVLYTSHGEQYVGKAVAEALFGQYNPAGRLSMTWYLSESDLPDINDYDIINNPRTYMYFDKPVQFPFGYGLSYTAFEYEDMSAGKNMNGYTVSCNVRNTGALGGDEVVQLYFSPDGMPVKAPVKQLCGFSRIYLQPGEMKTVIFDVPDSELRFFDENENEFSIIPESISFLIGKSSADIRKTTPGSAEPPPSCEKGAWEG